MSPRERTAMENTSKMDDCGVRSAEEPEGAGEHSEKDSEGWNPKLELTAARVATHTPIDRESSLPRREGIGRPRKRGSHRMEDNAENGTI